jgi:hypothetical protein
MNPMLKLILGAALLMPAAAGAVSLTSEEMIQAGCTQNPDGSMHCMISSRGAQMRMMQQKLDAMKRANIAMPPSQKPAINPNTGAPP